MTVFLVYLVFLRNTRDLKIEILRGHVDGLNGLGSHVADGPLFMFWVSLSTVNWKWPHPFEQQPEFLKWTLC